MTAAKRNRLKQELDQLWKEQQNLQETGDEAAHSDITMKIFQKIFEVLLPDMSKADHTDEADAVSVFFEQDWPLFDPERGNLGTFVTSRIELRDKDSKRKDSIGRWKEEKNPDTGEKKRRFVRWGSLDTPLNEEGEDTVRDLIPATKGSDPYENITYDETACQLLLLIMELPQRLEGRANNPTRQNYFRLFFTDGIATALHSGPVPEVFRKRENDLFHALKTAFLDYFMAEQCRTADEIAASSTRPFGQTAEGKGSEETPLPLPNDVYITYLNREEGYSAKAPAVTQQRQEYRKFIRKNLE